MKFVEAHHGNKKKVSIYGQEYTNTTYKPVSYTHLDVYKRQVQNMRKNMTEIVFIRDRSGSMSGLEKDTIGGFNSMIETSVWLRSP